MNRGHSPSDAIQVRRGQRQDTFDLRERAMEEDHHQQHYYHDMQISDDEEHMMEDGEVIEGEGFIDEEDSGSSLSIPNESIDFDLVYAFHSFAATVEGQANVVKGDSLRLIDDSNSYWWLVNVLNTQDVGYIPAENIETPLERLARLNKHRNVDLTYPTHQEQQEDIRITKERFRLAAGSRGGSSTPQRQRARVVVNDDLITVHNYPPAIWNEDEYEEDDEEELDYEEDEEEGDIHALQGINNSVEVLHSPSGHEKLESEDDGIEWDDEVTERPKPINRAPQGVDAAATLQTEQGSRVAQQARIGLGQPSASLRPQNSRERLFGQQQQGQIPGPQPTIQISPIMDPAEVTETRRITATPDLVRDHNRAGSIQRALSPTSPASNESESMLRLRSESPKRPREDDVYAERVNGAKSSTPEPGRSISRSMSSESRLSVSSTGHGNNKLRKEREKPVEYEEERKEEKKKKGGVLSSLFGRRNKDKDKNKSDSSVDFARQSEESTRSSSAHGHTGSTGAHSLEGGFSSMQSQSQTLYTTPPRQTAMSPPQEYGRGSTDIRTPQQTDVSPHTLKLQQADQQRQALYQRQHLTRAPGSPENHVVPSYGLQSASEFLMSSSAVNASLKATPERQRPGSLLLSPGDKQGALVPELSVIRVFAGDSMQTEVTFKTVLLNASTTSTDLVKQAMQRFRLAGGEEVTDYYLTIKQVDGPSAELRPDEKPLIVFESLVEAARLPKVNRNSISSLASNLSMHPAIQNLPMNDFTDDSAVKFYLNRKRSENSPRDSPEAANTVSRPVRSSSTTPSKPPVGAHGATLYPGALSPDRFSSPGSRFALQLVIYPEDLPEGVVFDPQTEAIIPRAALRERPQSTGSVSGISLAKRRKILTFPKNTTVAEVIELGLERFGIQEGVVDGGDDVEDKAAKRRSYTRVRYGLVAHMEGQLDRVLPPSSKILEAFPRPPIFKEVERRSLDGKRRSADSSSLLGALDDVQAGDPVFILRRDASRLSNRHSAPLDELALHRMHRDSSQSMGSGSIRVDDSQGTSKSEPPKNQLSRQELIAAQRAASRANQQRALLERGVDLLLPDRAVIRSSYQQPGEKIRYSYVDPDGEAYDISEIIEDVSRESQATPGLDIVGGVLRNNSEQLDRVLNKIKNSKPEKLASMMQSLDTATSFATSTSTSSQSRYSDETVRTPMETEFAPAPRRILSPTPQLSERAKSPPQNTLIQNSLIERVKSPVQQVIPDRVKSPIQHHLAGRAKSPTQMLAERAKSPLIDNTVVERVMSPTSVPVPASRETTPISRYATPSENPASRSVTPVQLLPRNRSGTSSSLSNRHERQPSAASGGSNKSDVSQFGMTPINGMAVKPAPSPSPIPKKKVPTMKEIGYDSMWQIIEAHAHLRNLDKHVDEPLDPVEKMLFGPKIDVSRFHPAVREAFGPLFSELERIDQELDDLLLSPPASKTESL